jgi:hypothetical protein
MKLPQGGRKATFFCVREYGGETIVYLFYLGGMILTGVVAAVLRMGDRKGKT